MNKGNAFFDEFTKFYGSTKTGGSPKRLNARHKAIIEANKQMLTGAHVVDIASHDGRWSFAALKAGATHIIGIEPRPHLVSKANEIFQTYEVPASQYEFIVDDVFEALPRISSPVDVVLLLGFLYHTTRHLELAAIIARTGARHVILDTNIISESANKAGLPIVQLREEATAAESNAVGSTDTALVADPSREAIAMIFRHVGYSSIREVDWGPQLGTENKGLLDYARGERATFLISRGG